MKRTVPAFWGVASCVVQFGRVVLRKRSPAVGARCARKTTAVGQVLAASKRWKRRKTPAEKTRESRMVAAMSARINVRLQMRNNTSFDVNSRTDDRASNEVTALPVGVFLTVMKYVQIRLWLIEYSASLFSCTEWFFSHLFFTFYTWNERLVFKRHLSPISVTFCFTTRTTSPVYTFVVAVVVSVKTSQHPVKEILQIEWHHL